MVFPSTKVATITVWMLLASLCVGATPTSSPSSSSQPSDTPIHMPSAMPSNTPSFSYSPSNSPSFLPSHLPSGKPSSTPTFFPSSQPSNVMSHVPVDMPSNEPSFSYSPSNYPSFLPSHLPSGEPSVQAAPTFLPSSLPSNAPTLVRSSQPSVIPSSEPSSSAAPSSMFNYEHVVERLDNWTTDTSTQSKVLQLVTHHDTLLGCYTNMQEFLSPFFHTLVVLPRDIAIALHVNELVLADSTVTAGVHLFFVEPGMGGAHHSRKIAEQFITDELEPKGIDIRYLHSILCDVHTLPVGHSKFVSMEKLTLRMERDFEALKMYRNIEEKNLATNYDVEGYPAKCFRGCSQYHPLRDMRVLAINTVLFEDVPLPTAANNDTVGKFHSNDVESWWRNGGLDNKPSELTNAGLPWFMDISVTFQEHAIMFDMEALRRVKEDYFGVSPRAFTDEKSFFGKFALTNNMTVLRNNDVSFTLELAHKDWHLNYPSDLDLDAFRNRAMQELMSHRSPREWHANWERASLLGIPESKPWVQFLFAHMRKGQWFPSTINSERKPVTEETTLKWLEWIFLYCGYAAKGVVDGNLVFEIEQVFPATRLISFVSQGYNKRLFTFRNANGNSIGLFVDNHKRGPPPPGTISVLQIPVTFTINRQGFRFQN